MSALNGPVVDEQAVAAIGHVVRMGITGRLHGVAPEVRGGQIILNIEICQYVVLIFWIRVCSTTVRLRDCRRGQAEEIGHA